MKTDTSFSNPVCPGSNTNYSLTVNRQELSIPGQKKFVPRSLCRCGYSGHKPFCDGNHRNADWLPTLRAQYPQCNPTIRL